MAKNFGKSKSTSVINKVAKTSSQSANVIQVKMIANANLINYKHNNEDIEDTADLETSIIELGFTDPIEVTDFGMSQSGKYIIVSGHRRRAAGTNVGMDTFPCIIKSFSSEAEVQNYVLLANSQRDSSKDPLLYCKRYKMHEAYLEQIGFSGSKREEIAKRLGISVQQADRYNQFSKIIVPIWDMVRDEKVGMSSVLLMAGHDESEQEEIYKIFEDYISDGIRLTRDKCEFIIKTFRDEKRISDDIPIDNDNKEEVLKDSGLPLNGFVNTEPGETPDKKQRDRNDEVRREHTDYDDTDPYADERLTNDDYATIEAVANSSVPMPGEETKMQRGLSIEKKLKKIQQDLGEQYTFESDEEAEMLMDTMSDTVRMIIEELYEISKVHNKRDAFDRIIKSTEEDIEQITNQSFLAFMK